MEYQLIRSGRRKTIALQVSNAQVIVRAPKFVQTAYVENLIQSKLQWLKQKVAQQKQNTLLNPSFSQQFTGDNTERKPSIYIDGLPHVIIIAYGPPSVLHNLQEQSLTVVINARYESHERHSKIKVSKIKLQIESWFKARLEAYIERNLVVFSSQMSLYATSFKVRKYKARWGSCNSRGELSFNYLLKMLPTWVVDYVIIHELCHLQHMNHSASFWQLVATHCPEYQGAKNWLRKHQPFLHWQ